MIKRVFVLGMLVIMVFSLSACGSLESDKISVGFSNARGVTGQFNHFFCGAKADRVVFDVDDIQIDFYFGWNEEMFSLMNGGSTTTPKWPVVDGYDRIGIAAYFYGYGGNGSEAINREKFSDYKNIENHYYIKEFPAEEFLTEEYMAVYSTSGLLGLNGSTKINYFETFTVPKEILNKEIGQFYFGVIDIIYSHADELYFFGDKRTVKDDVQLSYEYLKNNRVIVTGFTQKLKKSYK